MVRLADSDADIAACFAVMQQLRPQITAADFVPRVRRQMQLGYQLAMLECDGCVIAIGGFRVNENLAWGRFLYVDDLVTDNDQRSNGAGKQIFDWLQDFAGEKNCQQLHLDSGVQRVDAHRFYLREGLQISSHHFRLSISNNF